MDAPAVNLQPRDRTPSKTLTAALMSLVLLWPPMLTGCASLPPPTLELGPDPTPQAAVRFEGRMALTLDAFGDDDARAEQFNFSMQGHARRGEFLLSTPLGTQLAAVRWRSGLAWTETGHGIEAHADLDGLTRRMLGEALPLDFLWDWMAGHPTPDQPFSPLPATDGGRAGFEQSGWRILPATPQQALIDVRRPGTPTQRGVRLKIRLDP